MRKKWTPEELISFEDRIGELYLDNKLPFLFHLSGGNENQLIDIFENIKEGDYVKIIWNSKSSCIPIFCRSLAD